MKLARYTLGGSTSLGLIVGDELMAPIIDGEFYRNVKSIEFRVGPRVRIPRVIARKAAA